MNAEDYARQAHAGQTYGPTEPYTVHLEAVVAIVRGVDDSPEALATAWLHDVLEDTEVTGVEIATLFGAMVSIAVLLVTDPAEGNRRQRKERLHNRLGRLHPEVSRPAHLALLVKAADRLANVRACVASDDSRIEMYRREQSAFRAAAHRPGICDGIWAELDRLFGE